MRIAAVYDGVRESAGPYFTEDHPRIADPAERERVARFLNGGTPVVGTTGRDTDRIDADRGRVVPLSFRTDGHWVWSDALAYYVEAHGLSPEPELLRHIAAHNYQPDTPDEDAIRQAVQAVRPGQG